MKTRVVLVALGLAGFTLFGTSVNESIAPITVEQTTQAVPELTSTATTSRTVAMLPTVTPLRETAVPTETVLQRAGYAAASLSSLDPQRRVASLPTVVPSAEPTPDRTGCDPAYPDESTCIPPGPPFDQGCAIIDERRFTVRAPDPQGLDHDGDGIGCEPISSN